MCNPNKCQPCEQRRKGQRIKYKNQPSVRAHWVTSVKEEVFEMAQEGQEIMMYSGLDLAETKHFFVRKKPEHV